MVKCPYCDSEYIRRSGYRTIANKKEQRYQCMGCLKTFMTSDRVIKPKKKPEEVVRNWPTKLFRVSPELQEALKSETRPFQRVVEELLKEKYKV